jgi:hypothetical protein
MRTNAAGVNDRHAEQLGFVIEYRRVIIISFVVDAIRAKAQIGEIDAP